MPIGATPLREGAAVMAAPSPLLVRPAPPPAVLVALLAVALTRLPSSMQPVLLVSAAAAGMTHGGLDHLVGRRVFAPSCGRWWPAPFLAGYVGLAGGVLLLWHAAPGLALTGFLLLSVLHFGAEDARVHGGSGWLAALAHGGALVVVPAVTHGRETEMIFGWLAGSTDLQVLRLAQGPAAVLWLAAVAMQAARSRPGQRGGPAEIFVLSAMFALCPPLIGFALYFALIHTPRAFRSQARTLEICRDRGTLLRALPLSTLALLLGAALYWRQVGPVFAPAAVRTTFVLLSALTVPHMWLDWLARTRSPPREWADPPR